MIVGGLGVQSAMFSATHFPAARVDSSAPALSSNTLMVAKPRLCVRQEPAVMFDSRLSHRTITQWR
jgi:hypothetical protein